LSSHGITHMFIISHIGLHRY